MDIASKGLSPAINDPTTAVLAIDQIHRLLGSVGNRNLSEGYVRDSAGPIRLIYRTPDWEDFVHLAVTEIRQFGGESIQVTRRLRAMLENLLVTLPEPRGAASPGVEPAAAIQQALLSRAGGPCVGRGQRRPGGRW